MYAFAFPVKPVYSHLSSSVINRPNEILWKANLPLKINQKKKVWLAQQNYILTKDNLLRRKWHGSATCQVLSDNDTVSHLFLECSLAKYARSIVALVVGVNCKPCSVDQFWVFAQRFMGQGGKYHMVGLAAVCWALWRARNNVCFEKKIT